MYCNGSGVIVRFTTPTIIIKFRTIDPETITEAFLVFKEEGEEVLSKPLSQASVHKATEEEPENYIAWTLTQEETGALELNSRVIVCCDWLIQDGTRGRSRTREIQIVDTGKDEVIG